MNVRPLIASALSLCLLDGAVQAQTTQASVKSARDSAFSGTYWGDSERGWFWYENPPRQKEEPAPAPSKNMAVPSAPKASELAAFEALKKQLGFGVLSESELMERIHVVSRPEAEKMAPSATKRLSGLPWRRHSVMHTRYGHPAKTIISAALALVLACAPLQQAAAGDLQAEVDKMFDDLGALGNVTTPGAFRGQTYNTYTGGNLFLRTPNKVYQLGTMQFPYAKSSCGGIDVFGGSFSHISAEEFKQMLKSLTAALPGVAFQLALSSVSPLLGQKVEWIKSLETFINNARINTCETSKAMVNSAASAMGFDAFTMCTRIAVETDVPPGETG